MTFYAANVRTAISELLEGTIGNVRTVTAATFKRGVFSGQPDQTAKSLTLQTSTSRHWFDVQFGALRNHASTPVASMGPRRIGELEITIRVTSNMATANQRTQRETDLGTVLQDCETAAWALAYPNNLLLTNAGASTGLIGGCLLGPGTTSVPEVVVISEDWNRQVVITEIRGRAFVQLSGGLLLDSLGGINAVWAHWLGGNIRAGQGALFRVQRSGDSAESDFSAGTNGLVDTDALETWVSAGGGTEHGYLVTVYNAVYNSSYTSITATAGVSAPRVVISGAAVTGANGYLAAQFNGTSDKMTRADSLGLSGDVALTLCGDCGGVDDTYNGVMSIGGTGANNSTEGCVLLYAGGDSSYYEVGNGYATGAYAVYGETPGTTLPLWVQCARSAGTTMSGTLLRRNGTAVAVNGYGSDVAMNIKASSTFEWGHNNFSAAPNQYMGGAWNTTAMPTPASFALVCTESIPIRVGTQGMLDDWISTHHA